MRLTFHGAAGTVTGSRYLVESNGRRVLVDCGLFQGFKTLRERNWSAPDFDAASIDAVVVTHAHIDHSGYLPLLVRRGFRGPVYCTDATQSLCKILLPDSGYLQEADAAYAKRHGFSKHHPPSPLYTEADARRSLKQLKPLAIDQDHEIVPGFKVRLIPAGHILGACSVVVKADGGTLCFSGDLGRDDDIMMRAPAPRPAADWVVVESTYGNRQHPDEDPLEVLGAVVRRTIERNGTILIPAFAVGRTQLMLVLLSRLRDAGKIPDVPVVVDSPMATTVTEEYRNHHGWHRLKAAECEKAFSRARYTRSPEESKELDRSGDPMILVSASGMATGGRVVHHLRHLAPVERNTILFAGFQAPGTRGASIVAGAQSIKIHGAWVPVCAEVQQMDWLSAHADRDGLLQWVAGPRPRRVFVTHGEPIASEALRVQIQEQHGWPTTVPEHGAQFTL